MTNKKNPDIPQKTQKFQIYLRRYGLFKNKNIFSTFFQKNVLLRPCKCLRVPFLVKLQAYNLRHCNITFDSFTIIFERFWRKSQNTCGFQWHFPNTDYLWFCLLGSFTAITKLLDSFSKETCFHGNIYLDIRWDLWQWCLWQIWPFSQVA